MHPVDADILPPTRRPLRRGTGAVRAARVLVRQLDWLNWPVVWWGGSPPEPADTRRGKARRAGSGAAADDAPTDKQDVPPPSARAAIEARLRGRPAGAYAVRLARGEPALTGATDLDALLASTAPAVLELIPIDEALAARSLRRLARAPKQFPRALPKVVGDGTAWHAAAAAALKKVRLLIPPRKATPAEMLAIECAGVWLAPEDARPSASLDTAALVALARDQGAPQFSRAAALRLGQRKENRSLPPELTAWHRCGRDFAAWPLDVLARAAEAVGPAVLRAAASRDRALTNPGAADFVREALLTGGPAAARRAVANHGAFAALIDRLCEEPVARLGRLAAAQRDALASAVALSGVHGPVAAPADEAGRMQRWVALQLFEYAYDDAVAAAVAGTVAGRPAANRKAKFPRPAAAPPSPRRPERRYTQFHHLLGALRLWEHFLGDSPPHHVALAPRVHWLLKDRAFDFESIPALAAQMVWETAEPAVRGLADALRARLWALAARLDTDTDTDADADVGPEWQAAAASWVETCCAACRPGARADAHAEAAFLGLFALGNSARSLATLARFASRLTAKWPAMKGTNESWRGARGLLVHHLQFFRRATAAGVRADVIARVVRRGWVDEIDQVLSRRPQRLAAALRWLRRLAPGEPSHNFRHALVLLDADVLDALVAAGAALPRGAKEMLEWGVLFLTGGVMTGDLARGQPDKATPARQAFARAVPPVLAALPRFVPDDPKQTHLWRWQRAASAAFAWWEMGFPDPAAAFDALSRPALGDLLEDTTLPQLRAVVSLSLGRLDRLLALNGVRHDLNFQELEQALSAWPWLEPLPAWRELFSGLASQDATAPRTLKLLSRLGMCLRLHHGRAIRRHLDPLLEERDPPPPVAAALEGLNIADDLRHDFRRLCALRGGTIPAAVESALARPASLAAELRALESTSSELSPPHEASPPIDPARPDSSPPPVAGGTGAPAARRRRRIDNLRRYLADPSALRDWIESDLRKLVPAAVGGAALEALERLADETILSHATAVVGSPSPPASDARNWDNALRLYFVVEHNRGTLRKLLRAEAAGDRSWLADHPANRRFLAAAAARGIDVAAWTGPFEEKFPTPAGEWTVSLETDPLHVLQMGNYFETCLSLAGCNSFSTVANACEADKRVAYVRDARGVVVGRKLLLLTPGGRIVGFRSYGAGALDAWDRGGGGRGMAPWVKAVLDVFSRRLADRCRARLHPLDAPVGRPAKDDPGQISRGLFCHWYNDGPEPFDPPWLRHSPQRLRRQVARGGKARDELRALLQGDASEVAAARRVLLWLGEDGARVEG